MAPSRAWTALAMHEVRRVGGAFESKATRRVLLAAILLTVGAFPAVQQKGLHPTAGIYPVTIAPGAVLGPAARSDPNFREVAAGSPASLHLTTTYLQVDPKDPAAVSVVNEMRDALQRWEESELAREPDHAAAFPVGVDLVLQPRDLVGAPAAASPGVPANGAGTTAPASTSAAPTAAAGTLVNQTRTGGHQQLGIRPADVQPPFPMRSLLLTFAYLIPLNFVAQMYAGSLLADRVRKRGLLVLSTPLSPLQILAGRSMPYFAAAGIVYVAAGLLIGAGLLGWLAALPIVLFVLVAALVLGLASRSVRELTFLQTGSATMFSTFLFLPAIFTALPPVAFLSPVSVLAASIRGDPVTLGQFLYATLPLSLAVFGMVLVAVGLYREESLFSQRRLAQKLRDAVALWSGGRWRLLAAGFLLVPFALAFEIFVLALVIPLGLTAAFPAVVIGAAVLEESLKLLVTSTWSRRPDPWKAGLFVGAGFFVGEKLALVVALAGFGGLTLGIPTLRILGVEGGWLFFLAPLALHMVCAAVAGLGVHRRRGVGPVFWFAAVVLHIAYNLAVIAGGHLP